MSKVKFKCPFCDWKQKCNEEDLKEYIKADEHPLDLHLLEVHYIDGDLIEPLRNLIVDHVSKSKVLSMMAHYRTMLPKPWGIDPSSLSEERINTFLGKPVIVAKEDFDYIDQARLLFVRYLEKLLEDT